MSEAIPALITMNQAAKCLAVSTKTIRRMIDDGRIKAFRIGGKDTIRIDRDSVLAAITPI